MKQYRIGDYAKYLGVTPDLLKHYEEMGIIHSSRSESGYRYYSFQTTVELIESIRLRNYGLTLREIREVLHERGMGQEQMDQRIVEKLELIRQEVLLDEALIEEYTAFQEWREAMGTHDWDWEIRWSSPMLFLPHTNRYEFLQDPRIYELLNQWMSYIPIVKSCMQAGPDGRFTWGFCVREQDAQRLGLPVNEVVQRIPAHKIFYYKFRGRIPHLEEEGRDNMDHPAFRQLHALGLESGETYYRTTLMPADWQKDLGYQYGYYAIPLAE